MARPGQARPGQARPGQARPPGHARPGWSYIICNALDYAFISGNEQLNLEVCLCLWPPWLGPPPDGARPSLAERRILNRDILLHYAILIL